MSNNYNILSKNRSFFKPSQLRLFLGNMESPPEDYCALICRDPNKLCVINAHQEVVELIQRCLEMFNLDFNQESKGAFHL